MGSDSSNTIIYSGKRLSYVGQDAGKIPEVLGRMYGHSTDSLDLSYNALSCLDRLSSFPHLTHLVLDNNHLDDDITFPVIPSLQTLSINKNYLVNLDGLLGKISGAFPRLRYLSLLGNPACPDQLTDAQKDEDDYQRYRHYVVYRLPRLQFLDSRPVREDERKEAAIRGPYMRVARPSPKYAPKEDKCPNEGKYSPLPKISRESMRHHQGIYGKCRFRYTGKHSEGNRFIRNHDL